MNINKNVSGNCKKKCEYSFDYPLTNLFARNNGDHIKFTQVGQGIAPVSYNQEKYDVTSMKLYRSSVHTFGGSTSDAELMIEHVSVTGGGRLMVCIPVVTGSSNGSKLNALIENVSKFAPTKDSKGEISIPGFSLGSLIPKKPYYMYKGALNSLGMGDYEYNVIVFSKEHALQMSEVNSKKLIDIIRNHGYNVTNNGNELFYNPSNSSGGDNDEIFIDCQPVDAGEDETPVNIPTTSNDYSAYSKNTQKMIQILISFAFFFIGIFVAWLVYKLINRWRSQKKSIAGRTSSRGGSKK